MFHTLIKSIRFGRLLPLIVLLCVTTSVSAKIPTELLMRGDVPSLAPMIEQVKPAVVNIATQTTINVINPLMDDPFWRHFFRIPPSSGTQKRSSRSAGSGVIVDAERGLIVTNNHVIEKADEIRVTLLDGRSFAAELVGRDPDADLAVIRINAERLVAIAIGNSDDLRVGDFAVAIGNPFGLGQTVTSGIISGLGRSGLGIEKYESFIQTDASINPGNSGGALVNLRGELIGINTAILAPSGGNVGIGFAIPVNMAMRIKEHLVEYGEVRRGKIGVVIQDLGDDLAREFGVEPFSGIAVAQVMPGSSAEKAGIESGDIILRANGRNVKYSHDLINAIGELTIGEKLSLEVQRRGKSRMLRVEIQAPDQRADPNAVTSESFRLKGAMVRNRIDEPGPQAPTRVVVEMVIPGTAAEQAGLITGDLILAINRQKVSSVREVREMGLNDEERLLLLIQRDGRAFWVVVP